MEQVRQCVFVERSEDLLQVCKYRQLKTSLNKLGVYTLEHTDENNCRAKHQTQVGVNFQEHVPSNKVIIMRSLRSRLLKHKTWKILPSQTLNNEMTPTTGTIMLVRRVPGVPNEGLDGGNHYAVTCR